MAAAAALLSSVFRAVSLRLMSLIIFIKRCEKREEVGHLVEEEPTGSEVHFLSEEKKSCSWSDRQAATLQ